MILDELKTIRVSYVYLYKFLFCTVVFYFSLLADNLQSKNEEFCSLITSQNNHLKKNETILLNQLSSYVNQNGFSLNLLDCITKKLPNNTSKSTQKKIISLYEQYQGKTLVILQRDVSEGRYLTADSLYRCLDALESLSNVDYFQWFRVKTVLGKYSECAQILCKIPGIENMPSLYVFSYLDKIIETDSMSIDTIRTLTQVFGDCYLTLQDADIDGFRNWLLSVYERWGMYEEQIQVLERYKSPKFPVEKQLVDLAKRRFSEERYKEALTASQRLLLLTNSQQIKNEINLLIFKIFFFEQKNDSALVWLKKTSLPAIEFDLYAVILFQRTNQFEMSKKILEKREGLSLFDSLQVRQKILTGKFTDAISFLSDSLSSWGQLQDDRSFWKIRTYLFSKQLDRAFELLDSIQFTPTWRLATDFLFYKYGLIKFRDDPESFEIWAEIEYELFKGNYASAMQRFIQKRDLLLYAQEIALRIADEFTKRSLFRDAFMILDFDPKEKIVPEFLYTKSTILVNLKEKNLALPLLEKLVFDNANSIYGRKGAQLLNSLQK